MQKRILGKSNLEVSAIGLGCMGMSVGYGPLREINDAASTAIVQGARYPEHLERLSETLN
jgi:aryl-alcohol dehydrogenase-like predicted oxidoreductase